MERDDLEKRNIGENLDALMVLDPRGYGVCRILYAGSPGECACGCGGGILAASSADCIITATCSDWGCYGLIAALAYLRRDMDIMHTEEMEAEVMRVAARSGMIDMTGSLLPGIDGFDTKMNAVIVSLMRQCTRYSHRSDHWFASVLSKGYFESGMAARS